MASALETVQKLLNTIIAPIKVLKDKTYDAITYSDESGDPQNIQRIYPKDKLCEYITFFRGPTEVYPLDKSNSPKIFLGSACNAASYHTLVGNNIKYIINVSAEISNYYDQNFTYYHISIRDNNSDSMQQYLDDSYEKIDEYIQNNDGNILVHCYMGASRSATIVANYVAKKQGITVDEVVSNMRKLRPNVNLTQQFMDDLKRSEDIEKNNSPIHSNSVGVTELVNIDDRKDEVSDTVEIAESVGDQDNSKEPAEEKEQPNNTSHHFQEYNETIVEKMIPTVKIIPVSINGVLGMMEVLTSG